MKDKCFIAEWQTGKQWLTRLGMRWLQAPPWKEDGAQGKVVLGNRVLAFMWMLHWHDPPLTLIFLETTNNTSLQQPIWWIITSSYWLKNAMCNVPLLLRLWRWELKQNDSSVPKTFLIWNLVPASETFSTVQSHYALTRARPETGNSKEPNWVCVKPQTPTKITSFPSLYSEKSAPAIMVVIVNRH